MGEFTTLMARDGHEFQAYLAAPAGKAHGAIVVIQEIFGVNSHIRSVVDSFAAEGYTAIAPALFDRIRRGIQLGYSPSERDEGMGYVQQLNPEQTAKDLAASLAVVKHSGRVGTVGYCWGGTLSYLAACDMPVACAVVYYGKVANHLGKQPKRPVMYHFGTADKSIPVSDVDKIEAVHPSGTFYLYEGPVTDSTATSGRPSTRRPPRSPGNAPSNFSPATSRAPNRPKIEPGVEARS